LSAGSHKVTVKDANGCAKIDSINVGQPGAISLSLSKTDPTCAGNDGTITVTVSGGTSPYKFDWADISGTDNTKNRSGLTAGKYIVTVTDSNGCTKSDSVTLNASQNCGGHIFPTATSCADFTGGTAAQLQQICYTAKKGSVTNATPGVFFYYAKIIAPSTSFCVDVVQTTTCPNTFKLFTINQSNQAFIYNSNCGKKAQGTGTTQAHICITISPNQVGQTFVIGVKYDVKSIIGSTYTGTAPTCDYKFVTQINGVNQAGTDGSITVKPNCSAAIIASMTESSLINKEIPSELKVTAAPNPFTSVVNFSFVAPVSGKANLELYDLVGKKLAVVFSGDVKAGAVISVKHNMPGGQAVQ
jgi:hypothetical protein